MPKDVSPTLIQEIDSLGRTLKAKFSPPEFIPGCEIKDVTDKDFYASNNGWLEAVVAHHNQQRCRYRGNPPSPGTGEFIDVLYFPDRKLFECYGAGGTVEPQTAGGGVWPQGGKLVNTADAAEFSTVADLITDLAANEQGIAGEGSFACENKTLAADEHLKGSGIDVTELTNSTQSTSLVASGGNTIEGMTINNTLSTGATVLRADGAGVICKGVKANANASSSGATAFYAFGGSATLDLYDCHGICGGGSGLDIALQTVTSGATINVYGGYYDGDANADTAGSTINLYGPVLTGSITGSGTVTGYYFNISGDLWKLINGTPTLVSDSIRVQNTSGATVSVGDVGYTDEAGEFKTTTTAQNSVDWAIVAIGGDNNDWISVVKSGTHNINYTGSAPSAGDYLVTSTTAGSAQQQTTMHPSIFAVCQDTGSGGSVEALLLCNTKAIPITSSDNLLETSTSLDDSDFSATAGAISGATVPYSSPSGDEEVAAFAGGLGSIVLWNTTNVPPDDALISSVNTGTNTITLTANAPGTWANGENITIRSQTNTNNNGSAYFFDYEITSSTVPELTRAVYLELQYYDSGGANERAVIHPYEAFANSKRQNLDTTEAAVFSNRTITMMPLIERRFTVQFTASGSNTVLLNLYLLGVEVATP